jgi:hypothetical protein
LTTEPQGGTVEPQQTDTTAMPGQTSASTDFNEFNQNPALEDE